MPGFIDIKYIDIKYKGFVQSGVAIGACVLILLAFEYANSPRRVDRIGL